jgi:hypothetical protein
LDQLLIAAGGGAGGAVATLAVQKTGPTLARLRAWAAHDHHAIYGGWYNRGTADNRHQPVVVIRCAPSRNRKPQLVDVDLANTFAQEGIHGRLPDNLLLFTDQGLHFAEPTASIGEYPDCWLWNTGLIELKVPIGHVASEERPFEIAVPEVAEVILLLAQAVEDGWYARLYPGRGAGRVKLDWTVDVTRYVSSTSGSRQWSQLWFPGTQPGYGANPTAPMPPTGLLAPLTARPQNTAAIDLTTAAVSWFVEAAGYRRADEAISESIDVGKARVEVNARLKSLANAGT